MKTTSRIGYRMQDGGILSIYHNEGSPDWLLNILNTHYTDLETVAELIVGGDVSSCWVDDGPNHYESRPPVYDTNICFFLDNHGEEFSYLFDDGDWVCFDTRPSSKTYKNKVTILNKSARSPIHYLFNKLNNLKIS